MNSKINVEDQIEIYNLVLDLYFPDDQTIYLYKKTRNNEFIELKFVKNKELSIIFFNVNKESSNNEKIYSQLNKKVNILDKLDNFNKEYIKFTNIGIYLDEAVLEIYIYSPIEGFFRNDYVLLEKKNSVWEIKKKIGHRMS